MELSSGRAALVAFPGGNRAVVEFELLMRSLALVEAEGGDEDGRAIQILLHDAVEYGVELFALSRDGRSLRLGAGNRRERQCARGAEYEIASLHDRCNWAFTLITW